MSDSHGAAKSHDDHSHKGGAKAGVPAIAVIIGLAVVALFFFRACSDGRSSGQRFSGGMGHQREGAAVGHSLSPTSILRELHPEQLLRKQYLFINGRPQETADGVPILKVRVPLGSESVKIWVNRAERWSINPDIFEYREAVTGRWRSVLDGSGSGPRAIFPEFEIRLASGVPFDPSNPPEVTIEVVPED